MADDAGALLVRSGLISPNALADARARMETSGGTIGEQLVVMAAIGDEALTDFYRSRLLVPQVNPNTLARLPIKVVAAIPSDMAIELRAIPVALDGENNLTVAMSDPADRNAVDEITWFTGAYVVRAVATQMQIAWCLAHYYGHVTQLGQKLMQSTGASAAVSPPVARAKGLTGKVEALRHKRIPASGEAINLERPRSGEIVLAPLGANDSTPRIEQALPRSPETPETPIRAVSQPGVIDSDGVPDKPRARSISGEIRVPGRRAPSIRPPMPEPVADEDESGPVMTIEVIDQEVETSTQKMMPVRRRKAKTDPPELAARAGEVEFNTGPIHKVDLEEPRIIVENLDENTHPTMAITETSGELRSLERPDPSSAAPSSTIEVSDEDSASVTITEQPYRDFDSQPILLNRRRPSDQPTNVPDEEADDGDVVVLEAKKPKHPRPAKHTQMGIGALPAATRPHREAESGGGVPDAFEDAVTGSEQMQSDDPTVVTLPAPGSDDDISDERLVAPPSPDDTDSSLAAPPRPDDDDNDSTIPPPVAKKMAAPKLVDYDPVDDGWGPPGTTIPPPLLGAVPGTDDDSDSERIPVSNVDSAPLIIAPATPPQAKFDGSQTPARALEEATSRLIELIRTLEHTHNRDEVVGIMVEHLSETHQRAGFLAIKRDELTVFSIQPRPAMMPYASISLDRPSTLADVVTTRLPYRGPVPDEASRHFLTGVLGASPPEILLVPVAVRERVVGVLFAENRSRHTFDDQLAYASRAAGMALERILKAKRS